MEARARPFDDIAAGLRRGAGPVYAQIASALRARIESGELPPGERLPAIREFASSLSVNRDTVSLAYDVLAREGLVEATVGRGTFVCEASEATPSLDLPLASVVDRLLEFERSRPNYTAGDGAVALHSLVPDPSLYPMREFHRAMNEALSRGGADLLMYGGYHGSQHLREVIGRRLQDHGITIDASSVVLCQGASQGISLALRLYTQPGDWVAVEEPTYHNVLGVLLGLGLRATPIPMTESGPDLEALERTLARPEVKLFYTMPTFHNPLGTTTSLTHRRRLLEIAARLGKPVIEDAFEMDLRYDGKPQKPLAALDTSNVVVHLFSFSKSLFPGVRVGAITARGRAVEGLLALKNTTDLSGAPAMQAAVARFVEAGAYDRHLNRLRKTLRERRDTMLDALEKHMPDGTLWTRPDGGYQVWVTLPENIDSRALLREAQTAGVLFAPGYQFHHDARPSSSLRLTTALVDCAQIRKGIALLGEVTQRHLASGAGNVNRESAINI